MLKMVVALGGLALAACNPMAQADGADELAEQFHEDFSAGNFDKIWAEASDEFREGTPRTEFDAAFNNLRQFYGEYQGGSREGISLNTNNGVTTTEIGMSTTYANSRANESFIFIGTGEEMALLNWNIEPDDGSGDDAEDEEVDGAASPGTADEKPAS